MPKVAVIDLGTNTAHILIANFDKLGKLQIEAKKRHYTFLAKNHKNKIDKEAQKRLFIALHDFKGIVQAHNVNDCVIVGTEAFRTASNGGELLNRINIEFNWKVKIISGDQEAEFIYLGVREAIDISNGHYAIMDIGGGSVEFILTENGKLNWKHSFPIGIARIYNEQIGNKEPLSQNVIDKIEEHLIQALTLLTQQLSKFPQTTLIGAAGSFEILTKDLEKNKHKNYKSIDVKSFQKLIKKILTLSPEERASVSWIPVERVQYVTAAILLINATIKATETDEIIISPFALKEGIAVNWHKI